MSLYIKQQHLLLSNMINCLPIRMSKSTILLIVAILAAQQAAAQPTYLTETCRSRMGNYTTNSTYEANIKTVLSNLDAQSSNASFANTSAGSASASQVFGQYYCRGDINSSLCSDCINEAARTVFVNCHNFKSAVVWYDLCTLRYDNMSMVGEEAERPSFYSNDIVNVTDPANFGAVVNKTMAKLIKESAYGRGNQSFFATGEGVVSQLETAYCLVQCSPDLNGTECVTCLHYAYDLIPRWWSQYVMVYAPSCHLGYSINPFYTVQATDASSSPPPPPVTTTSPPTGASAKVTSRESFSLGLVISAVAFALFRFG